MQLIWVFVFAYAKAGFLMTRLKYKCIETDQGSDKISDIYMASQKSLNVEFQEDGQCNRLIELMFKIPVNTFPFLYEPHHEKTCLLGF